MLSRRLLIAGSGGSFTPPIPTPPNTPGSPSTILDDTYYNAWPIVCRAGNGNLVETYTKGFTHHEDNTGNMKVKISDDDGATWGSEIQGYFDTATPLFASPSGIFLGNSGRLLVPLWTDNYAVAGTGESGLVYSDDDGATWSSLVGLTNSFAQESFAAGQGVLLPGGDLLVTIEGTDSGPVANRSSHTLRSSDNGATWGDEVTIRDYATESRPYYETCLLLLDNGELIAVHRTSGGTGTHYISRSSDQGATTGGWGTPYAAFAGYGRPHVIQHSGGGLLAVTRKNSDASVIAFTSVDRGLTWDAGTVLDATMTEMEYGCPVELTDTSILVGYGYQPSGATNNSDLKQVILT